MARVVAPKAGRLFQESLLGEPFWMLVACSLVNLTTWDQARPAFEWIRSAYPEVSDLAKAEPDDLHEALHPLGLWRLRAARLPLMAQCWELSPPASASEVPSFPGCGRYAGDSWAIFVEGRLDVEPDDGKLNWYLERMKLLSNQPKETDMNAQPEPKTADLLKDYNRLAKESKLPTLGYWKGSKVALAAKIDTLKAAKSDVVKMPAKKAEPKPAKTVEPKAKAVKLPPEKIKAEVAEASKVEVSDDPISYWGTDAAGNKALRPVLNIATAEQVAAEVAAMPAIEPGGSIKDVACQLLTAVRTIDPYDGRKVGFSYLAVLARRLELFPGTSTSNACLRWYLVRIRQEIEGFDKHKMPIKFKRPKSKM